MLTRALRTKLALSLTLCCFAVLGTVHNQVLAAPHQGPSYNDGQEGRQSGNHSAPRPGRQHFNGNSRPAANPGYTPYGHGPAYRPAPGTEPPRYRGNVPDNPGHTPYGHGPAYRPAPGSNTNNSFRPGGSSTVSRSGDPNSRRPGNSGPGPSYQRPDNSRPGYGSDRPGPNHGPDRPGSSYNHPDRPGPGHGPDRPGSSYNHSDRPGPNHGPDRPGSSYNHPGRPGPGHGPDRPGSSYNHPGRPGYRDFHHQPYWRRSDVVFRFGGPRDQFWWGQRNRLSFGDFLLQVFILEALRGLDRGSSVEELYVLRQNGASYADICNSYGLDYGSVYARARLRYSQMHSYAAGEDIIFWGWDDFIG